VPRVQDARPVADFKERRETAVKVTAVVDERTLQIEDGRLVRLLGVVVPPEYRNDAVEYLRRYVLGKRVVIKSEGELLESEQPLCRLCVPDESAVHQPQDDRDGTGTRRT
jgi:hypothetical protein